MFLLKLFVSILKRRLRKSGKALSGIEFDANYTVQSMQPTAARRACPIQPIAGIKHHPQAVHIASRCSIAVL